LPLSFSGEIDAAINGRGQYAGKAYFIKGDQYVRWDWHTEMVDTGYPKTIASFWPALLGLSDSPSRRVVMYVTFEPNDHP